MLTLPTYFNEENVDVQFHSYSILTLLVIFLLEKHLTLPLTMMHHNHEMKSYTYLWQRLAWCSVYTEDNSTEQQLHFLSLLSFPFPPFDSLIFFLFCELDFLIHPSHKGQRRGSEELRTLPISVKVQKGQTNYVSSNLAKWHKKKKFTKYDYHH